MAQPASLILILTTLLTLSQGVVDPCSGANTCMKNLDPKDIVTWDETHSISTINWSILTQNNKSEVKFSYRNASDTNKLVYVVDNNVTVTTIHHKKQQQQQQQRRREQESNLEEGFLKMLASQLLAKQSPFDASLNPAASEQCKLHMKKYIESLEVLDMWALKMFDSSAKMPSGILSGNVNQFGDFDECLEAEYEDSDMHITPQYCLTYLQPEVIDERLPTVRKYHKKIQSNYMIYSTFDDPGHRVPRFQSINWAICVPSSCNYRDVEYALREYTRNMTRDTGLAMKVRVDEEMCQTIARKPINNTTIGTLIAGSFFGLVLLLVIASTVYDCKYDNEAKNPWYVAFSLRKNSKALFTTERAPGDIKSVHGIRCLNALMLVVAHKSMALFYVPYHNRTEMSEMLGKPWTVIGRAASLYTDPFIMLSGLLTAYSLVGRLQKGNSIRIPQEYASRLLRIMPPLAALIYFVIYLFPLLGSGPLWNLIVTHHSDICRNVWWRNLLFIHNYFGFDKMCLNHTHHVGIDTQLFLTVPFLVLLIWKYPKTGVFTLTAFGGISTYLRYSVSVNMRLSNYVYYGTSIKALFETADYMYIIPLYRVTVYVMGVILGYMLRTQKTVKLTTGQLKFGWYFFSALCLLAFLGPAPMGDMEYKFNPVHGAIYSAYSPILWCSFFGWIIYTSHLGYDSKLSRFFSWKGFVISTRLSYAIYLTQFPVFFFNVGKQRHTDYYDFFGKLSNVSELVWIIFVSIILTLLFDTPFGNINKIIFPNKDKKLIDGETTNGSTKSQEANSITLNNNIKNVETKEIVYNKEEIRELTH